MFKIRYLEQLSRLLARKTSRIFSSHSSPSIIRYLKRGENHFDRDRNLRVEPLYNILPRRRDVDLDNSVSSTMDRLWRLCSPLLFLVPLLFPPGRSVKFGRKRGAYQVEFNHINGRASDEK